MRLQGLERELEVDISAETLNTLRGLITTPKLDQQVFEV